MDDLPRLDTERLILRPPRVEELDDWIAMMSDPDVAGFIGGVQPPSMVWRGVMAMIGAWHATGIAMFSVIERGSGRWLGRIGPWCPHGWPGTEVGWALARSAWGQGYAHEAAVASMDYAFDVLGWDDVIHTIDPANTPSQRLAQRLGSTLRGPGQLPPPHHEAKVEVWGQCRAQWASRPRA
jgi:RimJ/RimL family protein N-acetyltransferase